MVKEISTEPWSAICLQEGLRNSSPGVYADHSYWRIQTAAGMRGSQMILLHPFLGNRLRNHVEGPDFVIVEVALVPPLILISYHAPSSSASPQQYQASFSHLQDEILHLQSRSPPGTRLILCGDLNTQLEPHYPTVGTWTNPSERPPDHLRANTALGAFEMLGMTVISSFFNVGPTRTAWPSAKRRGATDSTIDYIAVTSTLRGQFLNLRTSRPSPQATILHFNSLPWHRRRTRDTGIDS